MVVLWVLPPHLTAAEVFQTFKKGPGWSTLGLSMLASQSNILFLIIGEELGSPIYISNANADGRV